MIIKMQCQSCSAAVNFDDSREFMFCPMCGTKIMNAETRSIVSVSPVPPPIPTSVSPPVPAPSSSPAPVPSRSPAPVPPRTPASVPPRTPASVPPRAAAPLDFVEYTEGVSLEPNLFIEYSTLRPQYHLLVEHRRDRWYFAPGARHCFTLDPGKHVLRFRIAGHAWDKVIVIPYDNAPVNIKVDYSRRVRIYIDQPKWK